MSSCVCGKWALGGYTDGQKEAQEATCLLDHLERIIYLRSFLVDICFEVALVQAVQGRTD